MPQLQKERITILKISLSRDRKKLHVQFFQSGWLWTVRSHHTFTKKQIEDWFLITSLQLKSSAWNLFFNHYSKRITILVRDYIFLYPRMQWPKWNAMSFSSEAWKIFHFPVKLVMSCSIFQNGTPTSPSSLLLPLFFFFFELLPLSAAEIFASI